MINHKKLADSTLLAKKKPELIEYIRTLENNFINVDRENDRIYLINMEMRKLLTAEQIDAIIEEVNKKYYRE